MSTDEIRRNDWVCINCSDVLGHVIGGEFSPADIVPHKNIITRGPNLVITCPKCGQVKVFYTSDPVVRALYQLVDAVASQLAKRVISQVSDATLRKS